MLEKSFVITFIVYAVYASFREGMIFGIMQRWFSNLIPNIKKPLMDCPTCMTAWWGSLAYWLIWAGSAKEWIWTVLPAMGLSYIIVNLLPDD